jgi:hypothetical protein
MSDKRSEVSRAASANSLWELCGGGNCFVATPTESYLRLPPRLQGMDGRVDRVSITTSPIEYRFVSRSCKPDLDILEIDSSFRSCVGAFDAL